MEIQNINNIKISVIIPVYNVSEYLEQSLDSIINQTLKEIEIICIDDCSTDNSLKILEKYSNKDKRIRVIKHNINKGLGPARNTGIESSIGEYISFIDSDDYIELNFLELLYNTAKQFDSDISITLNVIQNINNDFKPLYFEQNYLNKNFEYELNGEFKYFNHTDKYKIPINVWTKIYKRNFIVKYGLQFLDIKYGPEDADFNLRAFIYEPKISFNNLAKYYYRIRENSLSSLVGNNIEPTKGCIKHMYNCINCCKTYDKDKLIELAPIALNLVLVFFNMNDNKNKKIIFDDIKNFINDIALDKKYYAHLYEEFEIINNNNDYESYMIEKLYKEINELKKNQKIFLNKLASLIPIKKLKNKFIEYFN